MSPCRLFQSPLGSGRVTLTDSEARHAVAARRCRVGDEVVLFDGAGNEAIGWLTRVGDGGVEVTVEAEAMRRYPFDIARRVTIAVAMPKPHRQGYLIEKCTELGVAAIWPILTDRGVSRPNASAAARWRRRAIEAAKQSGRRWIPEVSPPRRFAETLDRASAFDAAAMAHVEGSATPLRELIADGPAESSIVVWIGPEGGWSPDELDGADRASLRRVTLAPTMLRTETAAVAVCALAASMDGRSV